MAAYQAKYPNCKVVEWSYYFADKDWSNAQDNSPLGQGVDVDKDVILIVGHGTWFSNNLMVKTGTTKAGLVLTNDQPKFSNGELTLGVEEVAARLDWMGLKSNHKYIKTLSCCGAGLGEFEPSPNQLNVARSLNDKFRFVFARDLAMELGKERTWKTEKFFAHPQIHVGGYPGYVACKVNKPTLVAMAIKNDDQTPTTMKTRTNWAGRNGIEVIKREPYNRFQLDGQLLPGRVIYVPAKQMVPIIWYDAGGRPLMDKRPPPPRVIPVGFRQQPQGQCRQ